MLISFEGIDGAGKSTIMDMVGEKLREEFGYNIVTTKEPQGIFREIVLDADNKYNISELSRFFLYQADRALHTEDVIEPNLAKENTIILSDRGPMSTLAYQQITTGLDFEVMEEVISVANKGIYPHCYVFFDVSLETSASRLSDEKDYFDKMEKDFFERLIHNYNNLIQDFDDNREAEVIYINANKDIDFVFESCYNSILKYISANNN